MNVSILVISLVFALIEAGLSWLMLVFQPVASLFAGVPLWVITGTIFGIGMLLTFILIIIVGSMEISDRAAGFVKDHFGRTVLLAILSVLAVLIVSIGGEMLYQANPLPKKQTRKGADICFVLDYSGSMNGSINSAGSRRVDALKDAFAESVQGMSSDQRISVVRYDDTARVLYDWAPLTDGNRAAVINAVLNEDISGATDFDEALGVANGLVRQAVNDARAVSVIMISDGEDSFSGIWTVAPDIAGNNIRIDTINIAPEDGIDSTLREISNETGGAYMTTSDDVSSLTQVMTEITEQASTLMEDMSKLLPDTLLTPRWVSRTTIINARVLRIVILFLLAFWFKIIAIICIGNNDTSAGTHFLHAFLVAVVAALAVEFGYSLGLPMIAVVTVFWILMMAQIVRTD